MPTAARVLIGLFSLAMWLGITCVIGVFAKALHAELSIFLLFGPSTAIVSGLVGIVCTAICCVQER